jgi:2-dehydro-3-deoxyglucarate aldolase
MTPKIKGNERSMKSNSLHHRIRSGEITLGSWLQIGHPAVLEYMAEFGFEWLTVDLEHSDITIEAFTNMLRGAGGRSTKVFARVKKNSPLDIRQVLDVGAHGVIVPLVNNAEEACKAVAAAKYAPEGERGYAFCRANKYGINFSDYSRNANEETVVIIMIESKEAVANIDEILLVEGVDGVLIGPYDLSGSLGIPGQTGSLLVQEAMDSVIASCRKNRKAAGIHLVTPDEGSIQAIISKGFSFIALGMDNVFLGQAIEASLGMAKKVIDDFQSQKA